MVTILSRLSVTNNSGAVSIKVLKKRFVTYQKRIRLGDIIYGVVSSVNLSLTFRKWRLKAKDRVLCLLASVRKKYAKNNGLYLRFSRNSAIPLKITRFIVPIGNLRRQVCYREIRYRKRFKTVFKKTRSKV
jgi:ribosomal protein L14